MKHESLSYRFLLKQVILVGQTRTPLVTVAAAIQAAPVRPVPLVVVHLQAAGQLAVGNEPPAFRQPFSTAMTLLY